MSRCLICDVFIEQPKISPIDLKPEPCGACQRVIQETLESYNDDLEEGEDCYAYIEDESGSDLQLANAYKGNTEDA